MLRRDAVMRSLKRQDFTTYGAVVQATANGKIVNDEQRNRVETLKCELNKTSRELCNNCREAIAIARKTGKPKNGYVLFCLDNSTRIV